MFQKQPILLQCRVYKFYFDSENANNDTQHVLLAWIDWIQLNYVKKNYVPERKLWSHFLLQN